MSNRKSTNHRKNRVRSQSKEVDESSLMDDRPSSSEYKRMSSLRKETWGGSSVTLGPADINNEYQKVTDAHSLVLAISNDWRLSRSEWLLWVMNHMFRPLAPKEYKDSYFEVIEITEQSLPLWAESSILPSKPQSYFHKSDSPRSQSSTSQDKLNLTYRIVPHTQVYTLYRRYSMVFLLDISSSLTTIDAYRQTVLVDEVLANFRQCLIGITEPFIIPSIYRQENVHFQPQIHLSVLADFTQNVPGTAKPKGTTSSSIKILAQNIVVTSDNLDETFALLSTQFHHLQSHMADAYHSSLSQCFSPSAIPPQSFLDTESSYSPFLEAGMLSLRLLPQEGSPVVVLITDGVAEFGRADFGTGLRTLARDGVLLTVIQVGNSLGFTPGCSFGYVPDNEALRFLAMATGGKFIYADDCPEVYKSEFSLTDPVVKTHKYPNFYHRLLLIQEARFQRHRHDNRHASVNIGQERVGDLSSQRLLNSQPPGTHSDYKESSFPWSTQASPPPTEFLLTRYRDYALPLETSCILNARLREGFFIERIALSGSKQNRAEKIHINLAMTWLPNVIIQYRIRAQIPSDLKNPLVTMRSKYIRIEMNILASTVFAVSFVNIDSSPNNSGTSPLLTNVVGLHQFLKSIFATDDTLKSLNSMLQQFPMLKAPRDRSCSSLTIDSTLLQQLDVESVRALWTSFENSRLDFISNGLFDHYSTMLALIPELHSNSGEDLLNPLSTFRPADLSTLFTNKLGYSSISDTTYIKYLHAQKLGQHNFPSFCILRVAPISHYLMWTRLVFINVRYSVREMLSLEHAAINQQLIHSTGKAFIVRNCQRPLYSLLVDNRYYLQNKSSQRTLEFSNWASRYLPTASKSWVTSSHRETYFLDLGHPTIDQLVFSLLTKAKRAQGFIQIGNNDPNRVLFYKEVKSPWNNQEREFSVQYQLAMSSNLVTSHLWAEPITSDTFVDDSQTTIHQILRRDELVVSNLLAFDFIHHACRLRQNIFTQPLRLRSLVLNSVALISSYKCPHLLCNQPLTEEDYKTLRRPSYFFPSPEPSSTYSLVLDWDEEQFLKLHPVIIHYILFQFFLESSLFTRCDTLVSGQSDDPCDTFVESLSSHYLLPTATLSISPITASLKCGIAKTLSPTSFALVFIPNAYDMIQAYRQSDFQQDGMMNIWTYECIREDLHHPFQQSFNLSEQELMQLQQGPSYSNRYPFIPRQPAFETILGNSDRIEFWTDWSKSQPNISPPVHSLQSDLDTIYSGAFIQSLYSSLLLGQPIHTQDMHSALQLCWKLNFSISLTDYLNLKTEKERRHLDQEGQAAAEFHFQRKFATMLGYSFGLVPGWRGSYYFKNSCPPIIQTLPDESIEKLIDPPNEPITLFNLLDQASHPIFMRLHFVFSNSQQSPSTYSIVTNTLPTSYRVPLSELDYSPSVIGTDQSPLESADGTTASVQFSLYIPKSLVPLDSLPQPYLQSLLDSEDCLKHPHIDSWLPRQHLRALTETKSRIEWLIKEEVIHGLLTWSPITSTVLRWIDRKLSVRNPFVDFPSSFSMNLKLVDKVAGVFLFSQQLEHITIHPYCIVRCDEYFYVQPMKSSSKDYSHLSPFLAPRDGESPLVDGLGISVLESPDDEPQGLNFWMLLVPNPDQVQISFFSKSVAGLERSRIIQRIRRKIGHLLRKVNQILLLDELDTTRICSKYLLPPDSGDDGAESLYSDSDEEPPSSDHEALAKSFSLSDFTSGFQLQVGPSRFRLGQFECPLQFRELFTLHWRLKPMIALNHIISSVMHPLSVSNRHNLFVIRDSESAFYMRLCEFKEPSTEEDVKVLSEISGLVDEPVGFVAGSVSDHFKDLSRPCPNSPSFRRVSSHTFINRPPLSGHSSTSGPQGDHRGIALEVYGIQTPGREITQDLVSLIDGRLVNNLTLNIISSYLARNATLKLTPADVQFIFPLKSHPIPMARASFKLPPFVLNPMLALLYFKQNLLQYLHLLSGFDARQQYKKFLQTFYHFLPPPETCDCFVGDFVFFYNFIASRNPTPIEQSLGQGLGLVCLTLMDRHGQLIFQSEPKNLQHQGYKRYRSCNSEVLPSLLDGDLKDLPWKFQVHIDVWTIGSVVPDTLCSQVKSSVQQSCCDYMADCCIKTFSNELPLMTDKRLSRTQSESDKGSMEINEESGLDVAAQLNTHLSEPSTAILQFGADLGNPAMFATTVPCNINLAAQKLVVNQLHDWFMDYHFFMAPTVLEWQAENAVGSMKWGAEVNLALDSLAPSEYMLISGLDLPMKLGRPGNFWPLLSEVASTRRSSSEDMGSVQSLGVGRATRRDRPIEDIQLYPSLNHPHVCLSGHRLELTRSYFVLILIRGQSIRAYSYNLPRSFTDALSHQIEKSIAWQRSRAHVLDFILMQKLGLFHQQVPIGSHNITASPNPSQSESKLPDPRSEVKPTDHRPARSQEFNRLMMLIRQPHPPRARSLEVRPKNSESIDMEGSSCLSSDDQRPEGRGEAKAEAYRWEVPPITLSRALARFAPGHSTEGSKSQDYLQLHGFEFLEYYTRQLSNPSRDLDRILTEHLAVDLYQAYHLWQSNLVTDPKLDIEDISSLISTSHLLHFCRTPLFKFQTTESRTLGSDWIFSETEQAHPSFATWYDLVKTSFQSSYGDYLKTLGLQRLGALNESSDPASSVPIIYQMWVDDHLILISVAIRSMLTHIDIYAVPSLQHPFTEWSTDALKQCADLKNSIHGHSFGYDFHVHHLQSWLDGLLDATPNTNVLKLLDAFYHSSLSKSIFAQHSLTSGTVSPRCSAQEIYQYILKSPHRYGMRNIYHDNRSVGFCIGEKQAAYRQVIVITLEGNAYHYYALVVMFPLKEEVSCSVSDPITLIHQRIDDVLLLHTRDATWKALQDTPTCLTEQDIIQLESSFSHLDLYTIEPAFHDLPLSLPWSNILDQVYSFLPRMARNGVIHDRPTLLLFNPYDSQYLLYLRIQPVQMYAVARDPRSLPKVVECEHITSLMRTILYELWQTLHTSPAST